MSDDREQLLTHARASEWASWIRGPADEHAVRAGCYFDIVAAERVRTFIERFLKLTTGPHAGKPFVLMDWQWRDVIAPLFGWKNTNGTRRFQVGYLSTPKKNSKTSLSSAIALYCLLADGEKCAEVYSAAGDRPQASLVFAEMVKMIDASPALQRVLTYRESTKTVIAPGRCVYRALSAESRTKEGISSSLTIFDELHTQPNRLLWDCLRFAGASRRQPLLLAITTAGDAADAEASICHEQYTYAKRVLAGDIIDPSFYALIYEASQHDDWEAEATWHKANPSLGVTVGIDQFRSAAVEAKESPAKLNTFKRYRLNMWTQTADAWLNMDQWAACPSKLDLDELAGEECVAGLDLSSVDDLTAVVLLFGNPHDRVSVIAKFYLPAENIARLEKKHRVPYRAWAKAGHITLTPGNVVDYQVIRRDLQALGEQYRIAEVGMDRAWQGQALESELMEDGLNVIPVGAGWKSQDLALKRLEALVRAGRINHGGNPIAKWNAGNCVVEIDKAGNYSLTKKRSRSKIDFAAALTSALFVRMNRQNVAESYYAEGNEPIFL